MDFQHRAGGKTGGGGVAGWSESNRDRKERLRKLALETIDLAKVLEHIGGHYLEFCLHSIFFAQDPYFMKNHLGTYECKLCLTLHNTEVRACTLDCIVKEHVSTPTFSMHRVAT